MKTLKKVGVMSLAKFMAIMYALISLLMAILGSLLVKVGGSITGSMMMSGGYGMEADALNQAASGFSMVALITAPIMGAIAGFIGGAISAWIYNLVASWIGGIKLDLE